MIRRTIADVKEAYIVSHYIFIMFFFYFDKNQWSDNALKITTLLSELGSHYISIQVMGK